MHQLRNALKYIPHKKKEAVASALKLVYTAPTEEMGLRALEQVKISFPEHSLCFKYWETKRPLLSAFFQHPAEIRKMIYTTNAIEGLNRQFRKATKTTTIFPHDEALAKLLFLAAQDISKKWTMPVFNWGTIVAELAILFPEKADLLIHD